MLTSFHENIELVGIIGNEIKALFYIALFMPEAVALIIIDGVELFDRIILQPITKNLLTSFFDLTTPTGKPVGFYSQA